MENADAPVTLKDLEPLKKEILVGMQAAMRQLGTEILDRVQDLVRDSRTEILEKTQEIVRDSRTEILEKTQEIVRESRAEILDKVQELLRASDDRTQELVRDAQTEILKAFLPYHENQSLRMRFVENRISTTEESVNGRMAILERRLAEIEKKLLLNPPAA